MRNLFLFFLVLPSYLIGSQLKDCYGNPSKPLLDILETYGIRHDGSWETIVQETQKKWLRKGAKERWELEVTADPDPQTSFLLFSKLGMVETVHAENCTYDYAIILGATSQAVKTRLYSLKQEWENGVRFKTLVFLTGDRPFDTAFEGNYFKEPYPKNETEVMVRLFKELDLPKEWKNLPLVVVDTPRKEGQKRPNTVDTIVYWFNCYDPKPGTALIVSSQPFVGRGVTLSEKYFPTFCCEVIGQGVTFQEYVKRDNRITILLDELARWIYEENLEVARSAY